MANPRTSPDFTEIQSHFVTMLRKTSSTGAIDYLRSSTNLYPSNTTTNPGAAVAVSANNTVYLGQASDILFGKLDHSEPDSTCVVQYDGFMSFSFVNDANAPVLGRGVVCNGSNGVRIAAAGSEWKERGKIVSLDTTNLIAVLLLS
jgi:hypothetical protein